MSPPQDISAQVAEYEGLVFTTAQQLVASGVELDLDEIRQVLRIKVWTALRAFDTRRSDLSERRYVFGCVMNAKRDVLKRVRRYSSSIDEIRERGEDHSRGGSGADRFDGRYLSISAERVYFEIEDAEPEWTCLSELEREVVRLRGRGFTLPAIDRVLGLGAGGATTVMQSVRAKLEHLRPTERARRSAPLRPLPDAEPRTARPPAVLAA